MDYHAAPVGGGVRAAPAERQVDLHDGIFHGWLGVLASVVALALGPLLWRVTQRQRGLASAMDGFVLTSVGGLCLLVLLPELVEAGGGWALLAAALGVAFPVVVERLGQRVQARVRPWLALLVFVGLMLHAVMDGVALGTHSDHEGTELALLLGVGLHRLPVGLGLWVAVRPTLGRAAGWGVLGAVGLATLGGALLGGGQEVGEHLGMVLFQGFIVGSLLHVLVHPQRTEAPAAPVPAPEADACCAHDHGHGHGHAHPHAHHGEACSHEHGPRWDLAQSAGALVGVGVTALVFLQGGHDHAGHGEHDEHAMEGIVGLGAAYGERLLALALEVAPSLAVGYLLAGAAQLLPQASLRWLRGGGGLGQAIKGTLLGIPLPICSCGVVPIYRSLVTERGVPAAAAMAFLVATPELGLESVLLSLPLLGFELTAARLGAAVIAAVIVGLVVGRRVRRPLAVDAVTEAEPRRLPWSSRLREAARFGLAEVVDDTAPWIVLGLLVAAAFEPGQWGAALASLPFGLDVVLCAALGLPLYVCASGATPLAAALIFAGVSPGGALAFLLAGPATNIATWGVLSRLHGRGVALAFAAAMGVVAVALGVGVNLLGVAPLELAPQAEAVGVVGWVGLAVAGVLLAASVVRLGPVRFVGSVLHFGVPHAHDHSLEPVQAAAPSAPSRRPLVLRPAAPRGPVVRLGGASASPGKREVER